MFKATVIISVYRDVEALEVILYALEQQSEKSFSVVVSEDGESVEVKEYLSRRNSPLAIQHLTQEDKGFRKNRALNRAVLAAPGETLIFIDGDCVPHPKFVESHLKYAKKGVVNCGRRVNLGPEFSRTLRDNPSRLSELTSVWRYISHFLDFRRDGIRNYELGFYVPKIQTLMRSDTTILGCNFSLHRDDLMSINGFDEAYESPGLGEDTDVEIRLKMDGSRIINNKSIAIQYHLYHRKEYRVIQDNRRILAKRKQLAVPTCENGITSHSIHVQDNLI